jgi:virulence-associated protein VagC
MTADTVLIRREGDAIVLEPVDQWPQGYVDSFAGVPDDFARPQQGKPDRRARLR